MGSYTLGGYFCKWADYGNVRNFGMEYIECRAYYGYSMYWCSGRHGNPAPSVLILDLCKYLNGIR